MTNETDTRHDEFMRLFLQHEPRIYAYIRSAVFSADDAVDVLQETSMVLWRKFDEYQSGTHFDRWAIRIAQYQVRYFRQKHARDRLVFSDELLLLIEADHERDEHWGEHLRTHLAQCLGRLSAEDKDLVARRYNDGATGRTIARTLGRSESAVTRALNRITVALLRCMHLHASEGHG